MNATVQTTKIAASVVALRTYDKAALGAEHAFKAFGNAMASAFPLEMSYADYTAAAAAWKAEYSREGANEAAAQKAFERAIKTMNAHLRAIDSAEFATPKADNKKAVEVAAKRNAAKEAAAVIAKAKLGKPIEQATPAELLSLANDKTLLTANKEALVKEALAKEKAEKREADKAANAADKALRDDIREMLNKMHGPQLAKAKAALAKIK